jgi:hypothetical protein
MYFQVPVSKHAAVTAEAEGRDDETELVEDYWWRRRWNSG